MMAKPQEKNSRVRFWCLFGLLLVLVSVRYALQIDIPRVLFLLIIGSIAVFGDRDEIVAMCMALIPMHESVDLFYSLVICFAVYVFKYHSQFRFGYNVLLVVFIAVWELLHCFFTSFSIVFYLTCVIPFIILAILIASDAEKLDYPFMIRALAWAVLGTCIMMLVRVFYFANFNIALALFNLQRMGSDLHSNIEDVEVAGGQIHPNSLGIIAVLASTGLMQLRQLKASRVSDMVLMCAILVLAALSASRTYLACLALMIFLLIFSEKGGIQKKIRLLVMLASAIAIAVFVFAVLFPDSLAYYISRFFVSDLTTGREDLMDLYHAFIINNPNVLFFGIGLQEYGDRLVNVYRVAFNSPHNSIQEIIIAWGLPGLIIFAIQFFNMYVAASRRNKKLALINWIPLIIILFKGMAGQILTSPYTMLTLSYAYLSLCQDFSAKKEIDETGYNSAPKRRNIIKKFCFRKDEKL